MTKKKTGFGSKSSSAIMDSDSIQKHTEEFLNGGGQINVINSGVSGFNYQKSSKHITINSSKAKA